MKHRFACATFLGILPIAPGFAAEEKTITGWVLDSACAIAKGLKKPISSELRGGVRQERVAARDSFGQRHSLARLLPFAGKWVTATGKVYKQGATNSIVVEKIAESR